MVSFGQPPGFGFNTRGAPPLGAAAPGVKTIDMTPDGEIAPPVAAAWSWPVRLGVAALVVAVFAGLAASAMIFLWLASVLIPVALVAGCIAYGAFRFQLWRLRGRTDAAPPPWVIVNKR